MADVVKIAPLDAALNELAWAERAEDSDRVSAAIIAVAAVWIRLNEREQAQRLRYFRQATPWGASLRAALNVAAAEYDLGKAASTYAELRGRPWP